MCDDDLMTGTDTLALDGSRTVASSLEQNGHTYVETRITGSAGLFSCTWKSISEAHTPTEAKRILPDLCADFIVDSTGKSWLVGPATGADLVSGRRRYNHVGHPDQSTALRSLLGTAADAVQDSKIAFDDILTSRQARVLADALRHEAVDAHLLGQLWRGLEPDHGIERGYSALISSPSTPIREIAADLGVSERHFRRSITSSVGLSPKLIQKVQRMQNVLALSRGADLSLSSLAGRRRLRRPSSPRARYACTGRSDTDSATARAPVTMSEELFAALDHLAATSAVVIDRPRGSAHPRYPRCDLSARLRLSRRHGQRGRRRNRSVPRLGRRQRCCRRGRYCRHRQEGRGSQDPSRMYCA